MQAIIIGAGGVSSFLTPALCLLIGKDKVTVMDGDKLEAKNLNRQLFSSEDIGQFKAQALADKYGCEFVNEWFSFGARPYNEGDVLICCADNHPARAAVLESVDYHRCAAIIAANETHSASAEFYMAEWNNTRLDPRVASPEILTDTSGDPRRAAMGCTGQAQEANRQLVSANLMAASLALHLFVVWIQEARKLEREVWDFLPHKLSQTLTRSESFKAQLQIP